MKVRPQKAPDQMRINPIRSPGTPRRWIGGRAQCTDANDHQHRRDGPRKSAPFEHRAAANQNGIQVVCFDDLAAPAAGANEIGHRDTIHKHDHQRRRDAEHPMHHPHVVDLSVMRLMQIADIQADRQRNRQHQQRERSQRSEDARHGR